MRPEELMGFYFDKVVNHRHMNFFGYFDIPKNSILFLLTSAVVFGMIENAFHFYFIPSTIGVFLMWRYQVLISNQIRIAEKCVVEECSMEVSLKNDPELQKELKHLNPFEPLHVTDNDRLQIIEDEIAKYTKLNFYQKIKNHRLTLVLVVIFYMAIYSCIGFLKPL